MNDVIYLNGEFLSRNEAKVSVYDRGFLFGDGIYEVVPYYNGQAVGLEPHIERLYNSLKFISLSISIQAHEWKDIFSTLIEKNGLSSDSCAVYLQVSRGETPTRGHAIPTEVKPNIVAFIQDFAEPSLDKLRKGYRTAVLEDTRWLNCQIKTTALLGNVLLLNQAKAQGYTDALLHRNGTLSESTSSNIFVIKDKVISTPIANNLILNGVTRRIVLQIAQQAGFVTVERDILIDELKDADEVWLTSATKEITPVLNIDGEAVGDGQAGPVWEQLIPLYKKQYQTNK